MFWEEQVTRLVLVTRATCMLLVEQQIVRHMLLTGHWRRCRMATLAEVSSVLAPLILTTIDFNPSPFRPLLGTRLRLRYSAFVLIFICTSRSTMDPVASMPILLAIMATSFKSSILPPR